MKHILFWVIASFTVLMCDPAPSVPGYYGAWEIENCTERTLGISYASRNYDRHDVRYVKPGESVKIAPGDRYHFSRKPKFSDLIDELRRRRVVKVYDEDGKLLRVWDYPSDFQKEDSHSLYDEGNWIQSSGTWTYELNENDILTIEQ